MGGNSALDPVGIGMPNPVPSSCQHIVEVKISDADARRYPFTSKLGDIVAKITKDKVAPTTMGETVDGTYEGSQGVTSFVVIYPVKRLKDGTCYDAMNCSLARAP